MKRAILRDRVTKELIKRDWYPRHDLAPVVDLDPSLEWVIEEKQNAPSYNSFFDELVESESEDEVNGVLTKNISYSTSPLTPSEIKQRIKDLAISIVNTKLHLAAQKSVQILDSTGVIADAASSLQTDAGTVFTKLVQLKNLVQNASTREELMTIYNQVIDYEQSS